MRPNLSHTLWFTQRTGSTLLCKALEGTQLAGIPNEWLGEQQLNDPGELQRRLWEGGCTSNAVFGRKHSFHEPHFTKLIESGSSLICSIMPARMASPCSFSSLSSARVYSTRSRSKRMALKSASDTVRKSGFISVRKNSSFWCVRLTQKFCSSRRLSVAAASRMTIEFCVQI